MKHLTVSTLCVIILLSIACQYTVYSDIAKPNNGIIIFESYSPNGTELIKYEVESGNFYALTQNDNVDKLGAFNPKTNKLAFVSDRGGGWNIWQMDLSGGSVYKLTDDRKLYVNGLDWTDNGGFLAASLQEDCEGCVFDIVTITENGRNLNNLTQSKEIEFQPHWSPNGNEIIFVAKSSKMTDQIYIMDNDGKNITNLTKNDVNNENPHWSPNGKYIVFSSEMTDGDWDIYIMDSNGENLQLVTKNLTDDITPNWSPDGNKLVYSTFIENNFEIVISDLDGTNQIRLTHNPLDERTPLWIQFEGCADEEEKTIEIQSGIGIFANVYDELNRDKTNQMEQIHE